MTWHARSVVIATALGGMMMSGHAQESAQVPRAVFRSNADVVTMDVTVTMSGTPVGGLRAGDFMLTDNGVPQLIEVVALEAVPAAITIIVDMNVLQKDTISETLSDVRRILAMARPADQVRLMAIDSYVRDVVPLQPAAGWPDIERLPADGVATVHDAIAAAIMRHDNPEQQHLIVALTNVEDTGSVLSQATLLAIARRSSSTLHVVTTDLYFIALQGWTTRASRAAAVACGDAMLCSARSHFWAPYHDKEFDDPPPIAEVTGGTRRVLDPFVDRNAGIVFRKFYDDYRRSYRLRYTPTGVSREGWHEVAITTPKYSSYKVTSRPGYVVEAPGGAPPVPESPGGLAGPASGSLEGVIAAYDREEYDEVSRQLRRSADVAALIKQFEAASNPWPNRPQREAAFVLELAHAALASGRPAALDAARVLLDSYRPLVRGLLGPDAFEKYWLWTTVSLLESVDEPDKTLRFVDAALRRFPSEPRLLLARAFVLDRRSPFGAEPRPQAIEVRRSTGIVETPIAREDSGALVLRGSGFSKDHLREVSEAYDAAMASAETGAEARIRKAWLLYRADEPAAALALLESPEVESPDPLLRYWRQLFLGRVLDAMELDGRAANAYRAALEIAPQSQSPKVALMASALLKGDRATADRFAAEVQTAPMDAWDPWWNYWQGDGRLFSSAIARLRAQTR